MNLKHLRTLKGATQKDVSRAIGCSEVVYSRYENGDREPSFDMLIKLADYFEVTTDLLLGHTTGSSELLSDYEVDLVFASRCADERARQDALAMLKAHEQKDKKKNLA